MIPPPSQTRTPNVPPIPTIDGKKPGASAKKIAITKISKTLFLVISVLLITLFLFLKIDLNQDKNYLGLVGISENTGIKHQRIQKNIKLKESANQKLKEKIAEYRQRIQEKRYSTKQDTIAEIQKKQKIWFDEKIETLSEENIHKLGVLGVPKKVQNFFNSQEFFSNEEESIPERKILYDNQITIQNISVEQDKLKLSASASNLYGQVFFLSSSFVEAVNQFPQLSQGSIKNFRKKKNQQEEDISEFNIHFVIQEIASGSSENTEGTAEEKTLYGDFIKDFIQWQTSSLKSDKSNSDFQNTSENKNTTIRRIRK
jgi:hypothetical protein